MILIFLSNANMHLHFCYIFRLILLITQKVKEMNALQHYRNKSLSSNMRSTAQKTQRRETSRYHRLSNSKWQSPAFKLQRLFQVAKQQYQKQQNLNETVHQLQHYLHYRPDNNEAIYMCGVCLLHLNKPSRAISYFKRLNASYINNPQAFLLTAMAYVKLQDFHHGLQIINECIGKYPFEDAFLYKGKIHLMRQEYILAQQEFLAAVAQPNATPLAKISLGDCYRVQQSFDKALLLYEEVLKNELSKEDTLATSLKLGLCLYALEEYTKAQNTFEQLANIWQTSEVFYNLGLCQMQLECYQKATLNLEYSLRVHTDTKSAIDATKCLLLYYFGTKQFYEAANTASLSKMVGIQVEEWYALVEAFMQVIRGEYCNSLKELTKVALFEWSGKEGQMIFPLILLFKAYAQFFQNELTQCIDTYDQYEAYLKDVLGKESDISYNKNFCQAILLAQCDLYQQAAEKFNLCRSIFSQTQPLLYHISMIIKKTINEIKLIKKIKSNPIIKEQSKHCNKQSAQMKHQRQELLQSTSNQFFNVLQFFQEIESQSVGWYFKSIVYILCEHFADAAKSIQQALKLSEDCKWEYLYMKGVIELLCCRPFQAIKAFTAGILIQRKAELYLGRCLAFFKLSQSSEIKHYQIVNGYSQPINLIKDNAYINDNLNKDNNANTIINTIQNISMSKDAIANNVMSRKQNTQTHSLDDLHSFIELSNDKNFIDQWVIKILFCHGAYEQVASSVRSSLYDINALQQSNLFNSLKKDKTQSLQNTINIPYKTNKLQISQLQNILQCLDVYEGEFQTGGIIGQNIKQAFQAKYISGDVFDPQCNCDLWLVILQLYVKEEYNTLMKYLQHTLFTRVQTEDTIHIRYNIVITFLLMRKLKKSKHAAQGLNEKYNGPCYALVRQKINKIINEQFQRDECVDDLRMEIGLKSKLLSCYLSYRMVQFDKVNVYVKLSIPFPTFPLPDLTFLPSLQFILRSTHFDCIPKKFPPPWLNISAGINQFTSNISNTEIQIDTTS